ncbi:MAG: hypothetical protein Q7S22_00535 [Candidatus Micrarchaeota archaeon]|nr:hypothetical protein [Candidatus Micrarchaeota archaeon]
MKTKHHRLRLAIAAGVCLTLGAIQPELTDFLPRNWVTTISRNTFLEELSRINTSKLDELPNIARYTGLSGTEVKQAHSGIIHPNEDARSLYTDRATTCSILILVAKKDSRIQTIGLAHIDDSVTEIGIREFYNAVSGDDLFYRVINKLRGNAPTIDAYVISGIKENALKVLRVLLEERAKIVFFNADVEEGLRSDAAIVDRQGKVYVGGTFDLVQVFTYLGISEARRKEIIDDLRSEVLFTEELLSNGGLYRLLP